MSSVVLNQIPDHLKEPPAHLSPESREFFLHLVADTSYDAPARDLLITYCEIRDRLTAVREELKLAGRYFTDKHGQPREHPLAKEEKALINEKGKLFRLLCWDQAASDGGQGSFFFAMGGARTRNASD